ncbi:MAG TPA: carboxypeptidase regulatory-like domain-containing protein [Candidatus Binatia bacterium]|nr:carboxypeptidase regulatory-like domain-containing protein [Candidatus Binatia bacterium]
MKLRALLSLALLLCSSAALAQSAAARGTIGGTVTDPLGNAVAGAQVTIRSADFTSTRTVATSDTGTFTAPLLNPGVYTVEVRAPGFRLKKPVRLTLAIGSSVQLAIQLGVAGTSENVTVAGHGPTAEGNTLPPAINKQAPQVSNTIAGLTVTYLPNRDRDFTHFAQLAAGVDPSPNYFGLIFDGQRPINFSAAVDGFDFTDPLNGGQRGSGDASLFFPQTVVREFQVVHAGATAEVGGTNAGFVNILTKEGSNKYHGEAFYIGRPSWTAADAFGHSLDNAQNEFGGSVGGPIRKDKAFFYVGAEQDYLNIPYWTQFEPQPPGTTLPPALANLQRQIVGHSDPTSVFARADVLLDRANTLNLQFNFNRVNATNLDGGSTRSIAPLDNAASLTGNSYWVRGNLTTVFGADRVNQFLAQWAQDRRHLAPTSNTPEMVINGFGVLGGNALANESWTSDINRYNDDYAITRGGRLLHLGVDFSYNPANLRHEANLNGRFDFDSLADFLAGDVRRYQQTFYTGNPWYSGAVKELGFYIDARLPVAKALTITAGLRWDGQWNPQPSRPNPAISQTVSIPNDLSQWQPRLGIAWNPASNTVVRLSAGLYDAPTPANVFQRMFTDNALNTVVADSYFDPQILPLVTSGGYHSLAAPPPGLTTPAALVVGIAPGFRNPRSFQVAGAIEQQLTPRISLTAGYVHDSTWDLQLLLNENLFPPTYDANGLPVFPPARPDPAVGQLLINQSSAHATYDGMLLTANFQLPHRSQLSANYTLARARDDDSSYGPFSPVTPLNPFNLAAENAYSNFDVRNSFNVSAITNLPLGFKFNPILVARSPLPYRPATGFDSQGDANDWNDRAIINGRVAQRNSLRQPSFFNLDVRFVKDITLRGEGHHLDLFLDIFNVTNFSNRNFGPDEISVFGTTTAPIFSAGQALFAPDTNHFGSARQVQLTARITAF